ncbi:MAG: TIR domain-containing protein [bacterium]
MGYVLGFENDIFISYTHIDNDLLAQEEGWVSFFHDKLRKRLRQLLGAELDIWRDAKLQGNDYLSDALLKQLPRIAILVSILSPRYIQSEWCLQELQEFAEAAEKTGGLRIHDKARIFKVVKTPIPREQHPPALQGLLGYEFFKIDPQTDRPSEFRPELGPQAKQKFWEKLEDLAYDVHLLLKELKANAEGKIPMPSTNGAAIYLAQTTSDLHGVYDTIRRELLQRHCAVLPEGDLPLHNTAALKQRVLADLGRSSFFIHLIGEKYGLVPEDETHSFVQIQHELAEQLSRASNFWRLIWLPHGLKASDARQQDFIQVLRTGGYWQQRADLLETPLEELKTTILSRLRNGKTSDGGMKPPSGPPRIYLICDRQDRAAAQPVATYLFSQGFEVEWPAFEGDETMLRETHQNKMVQCDAVLIFCGEALDTWLGSKTADLEKVYGWQASKPPFKAQAIYFAPPQKEFKELYLSHQIIVTKNFAAFRPEDLRDFVAALRAPG